MVQIKNADGTFTPISELGESLPMTVARTENSLRELLLQATQDTSLEKALQEAGKQAAVYERTLFNAAVARMVETVENNRKLLTSMTASPIELPVATINAIKGLGEIRKILAVNNGIVAALESVSKLPVFQQHVQIRALAGNFILPHKSELQKLAETIHSTFGGSMTTFQKIQTAMFEMKNPWIDVDHKLTSVTAFARLHSIGNKLGHHSPFGDSISKDLRTSLGDWRGKITIPESTLEKPETKQDLYSGLGFDHSLVSFPEKALDETLNKAGIISRAPDLTVMLGDPLSPEIETSQNEAIEFNKNAYTHLFKFEIFVRAFINNKMVAQYGEDWPKRQLPAGMMDDWMDKKSRYKNSRQEEYNGPLIDFADFTQYELIITRKDNWNCIFKPFFKRPENVRETFQRLGPLRIDTMHSRLISRQDYLLLFVELKRIHQALIIN